MARRLPLLALLLATGACREFPSAPFRAGGPVATSPDAGPERGDAGHAEDAATQPDPSCEDTCASSDLSHCSAQCERGMDGQARCVVRGLDQDGDGHFDARCSAGEASDDCDDGQPSVHPGALELCDGLDNDCNGRVDLQDGLAAPAAESLYLEGLNPALAWDGKSFGLAYESEKHELLFAKFSVAGKRLFDRAELIPDETVEAEGPEAYPSIEFGNGTFGVAWTRPPRLNFMRITGEGVRSGGLVNLASGDEAGLGRSLTRYLGNDRWLAAFTHGGVSPVSGAVVTADDSLEPADFSAAWNAVGMPGVAVADDALATIWSSISNPTSFEDATSSVWWVRRTLAFAPVLPGYTELVRLTAPSHAETPIIASSPHGYALAWVEVVLSPGGYQRRLVFQEFDLEGKQRCGPVDLARNFDPGALTVEPVSMVYGTDSYVMLLHVPLPTGSGESGVDLLEVRPGCEYVQRFRAQRLRGSSLPALASAGEAGFLLVWQEAAVSHPTLGVQKLGPRLCD